MCLTWMKGMGELSSGLAGLIYNKSAFCLALPSTAVCESIRWMNRDIEWMDSSTVMFFLRRALRGMECG